MEGVGGDGGVHGGRREAESISGDGDEAESVGEVGDEDESVGEDGDEAEGVGEDRREAEGVGEDRVRDGQAKACDGGMIVRVMIGQSLEGIASAGVIVPVVDPVPRPVSRAHTTSVEGRTMIDARYE